MRLDSPADWQLPVGVDRGLWDYFHSNEMVAGYDEQMAASPLAAVDLAFCDAHFPVPGRVIDLGCGTGRLCQHLARRGFTCLGVDLSTEMLTKANEQPHPNIQYRQENLVDLKGIADQCYDYAACLFSTLGMIRGRENRLAMLRSTARVLVPRGQFVLHVHNRWFRNLGFQRYWNRDISMSQAYGGAPLTLHHYSRREIRNDLVQSGFRILELRPISTRPDGRLAYPWWRTASRAYGYMIYAEKRVSPI